MPTQSFWSLYCQGFARVAAVTVPIKLGCPTANAALIIEQVEALHDDGVALAVFPEMSLTGYSVEDLVMHDTLLLASVDALGEVVAASHGLTPVIVVGLPLEVGGRVLNCAAVVHRGRVLGIVPKLNSPSYREFYESRWFGSGAASPVAEIDEIELLGNQVPFGSLIFQADDVPGFNLFVEVGEDLRVPAPASAAAAIAGATVIANPSASPASIGRADDRHLMVRSASARNLAAHVFVTPGAGESTNDLAWDGGAMIYEGGDLLGESLRFADAAQALVADIDLDRLRQDRLRQGTFHAARNSSHLSHCQDSAPRQVTFTLQPPVRDLGLRRAVNRFPFVPNDAARLAQDCFEAFNIQVAALTSRLRSMGQPKVVLGVSGGLDSTHALLVAAQTMDRLGRPRSDILGYTLPGFATGTTTKERAWRLGTALGITFSEIDIRPASTQMLADIGHPYSQGDAVYDITFENVQAGLRTDYLFRIANHLGGIVLGTGDLSELALGWCTYGVGDHMSHYGLNAGVPKTLIQYLIRWAIETREFGDAATQVLGEILEQEISPELVPAGAGGALQSTQDLIGPYNLQDFNLYYTLRYGYRPSKIAFLAWHAWSDAATGSWPPGFPEHDRPEYDLAAIKQWLKFFVERLFTQQFKRTCVPGGPKVTAGGSLSPRGDWRMPTDASSSAWLADVAMIPDV